MERLRVSLFGTFRVRRDGAVVHGFDASRAQELFCYLLLNRDRSLARENVASVLWGECTTTQSRAYLRKALWQLQSALDGWLAPAHRELLRAEPDSIQIDSGRSFWLDVAVFEEAFSRVHGVPGESLDQAGAAALREAVELYGGDLLENWYHEWCSPERERLRNMHLVMLEKLMGHAAANNDHEIAIEYGERILRHDCARELTHQELMRLRSRAGDRTGALRQYERCLASLREELGVEPGERTLALHEQIRAGICDAGPFAAARASIAGEPASSSLRDILGRLHQLQTILLDVHSRVEHEITMVENALGGRRSACPD